MKRFGGLFVIAAFALGGLAGGTAVEVVMVGLMVGIIIVVSFGWVSSRATR